MMLCSSVSAILFLSTPSARRATRCSTNAKGGAAISIHALREEGDVSPRTRSTSRRNFYPRPPRGGRPPARASVSAPSLFLSTPSARRATYTVSQQSRP